MVGLRGLRLGRGASPKVAALAASVALVLLGAPVRAGDEAEDARGKAALKAADRIEKEVQKIRGLKYQAPVTKGIETTESMKKSLLEEFAKPENKEGIEKDAKVAKAFGLIPKTFDLGKETEKLLADQIAGFYDQKSKKLRLVVQDESPLGLSAKEQAQADDFTMAHELEHALQDQNFELDRWFALVDGHDDRIEAWKCVVEGEAVYVSLVWLLEKQKAPFVPPLKDFFDMSKDFAQNPAMKKMTEDLDKLPPFLVKPLMMPYEEGAIFVQKVYDKGGWDAVSKLFRDPPSSTQQILHPKKFFDRVEPAELTMPSMAKAVGPKSKEIDRSTLGEYNTRILLETLGTTEKTARSVSAGWHGDQYQAIDVDGETVLVWLSIWEDETKATAFEDAYRTALGKLHGGATGFTLTRKGTQVVLVDGKSDALRSKLEAKAFLSAVQDGHLQPLPGFQEKPSVKDFTDAAKEDASSSPSTVSLGSRVSYEDLGVSIRLPSSLKKQEKDGLPAELTAFSRGYWKNEDGGELRVLDVPLPFDKESLRQQFEDIVKKSVKEFKKIGEGSRSVGGHEALEIRFEGVLPDGTNEKRELKGIAIERDDMTFLVLVSSRAGKLDRELSGFEAALATLEIVPGKLKDEAVVRSKDSSATLSVGAGWKEVEAKVPAILRVEKADGSSIQVVATKALRDDLDGDARAIEAMRAGKLDSYRSLGGSAIDRDDLGRAFLSDYEFKTAEGTTRRVRELVTLRSGKRYAVTCACAPEAFEKNRQVFTRALATFSLGKAEKTEPTKPEPKKPEPKKPGADEPF